MKRTWDWGQLAVAYGLLEVALWTEGETQRIAALLTAAWIVAATLISRRSPRQLGLGFQGLGRALVAIPIAAAASMVVITIAWQMGTLRELYGVRPPIWHSFGYAIWAMMQQFILNSFFYMNLEELLGSSKRALWGAAALFCLAHIPNPVLMVATLGAAIFFVSLFQRYRNIYPLGVAHAMLGLTLACTIPDLYLRHMRVGISYFHFLIVR
ncbi:MAG: CPBP family glutamic-type intramembrane protease [Terriglobales bacterium]